MPTADARVCGLGGGRSSAWCGPWPTSGPGEPGGCSRVLRGTLDAVRAADRERPRPADRAVAIQPPPARRTGGASRSGRARSRRSTRTGIRSGRPTDNATTPSRGRWCAIRTRRRFCPASRSTARTSDDGSTSNASKLLGPGLPRYRNALSNGVQRSRTSATNADTRMRRNFQRHQRPFL